MKKLLAIVDDWERLERYEDKLHRKVEFHSSPFGGHGVELAIQERPDIILIDLEFEDMNALEVLALIRAQDSLQNTSLIVVSEGVEGMSETEWLRIFQRPISVEAVLSRIASAI